MAMQLRVWSSSLGYQEVVVAARSKTKAAEALGWTLYMLNAYAGETGNDYQIKVAMTEPGTAFIRSNNWTKSKGYGWWRGPRWDKPWETGVEPDVVIEP